MMMNNPLTAEELAARLQLCIDRLDDAIVAAREARAVDVADMETEVERLCDGIGNAPVETGHAVQGLVAGMIARLDMLESELRAQRDEAARDEAAYGGGDEG